MASAMKNYKGMVFGRWTVISDTYRIKSRQYCLCRCACGKEKPVRIDGLLDGHSIGCVDCKEMPSKYTKMNKRLYKVWTGMKQRCYNKNNIEYSRYGGRGIVVCPEWKNDFEAFQNWAFSNGYDDTLTIDRINNDGIYEPANCRWVTMKEQLRNCSRNIYITYKGETKCVQDWCEQFGLKHNVVCHRYKAGLPLDLVFSKKGFKGTGFAKYKEKMI